MVESKFNNMICIHTYIHVHFKKNEKKKKWKKASDRKSGGGNSKF